MFIGMQVEVLRMLEQLLRTASTEYQEVRVLDRSAVPAIDRPDGDSVTTILRLCSHFHRDDSHQRKQRRCYSPD
jgi:hypothetical protein